MLERHPGFTNRRIDRPVPRLSGLPTTSAGITVVTGYGHKGVIDDLNRPATGDFTVHDKTLILGHTAKNQTAVRSDVRINR